MSTVPEIVGEVAARMGAPCLFGMPGGGPNLDLIGAAQRHGSRFVLAHGETAACIMAGAHGLLAGRPALAVATRGPGAASAVNGLAQATLDQYPMVLATDVVPAADAGRVAHQRLDQRALLRPAARWSATVGHRQPESLATAAFGLAMGPPAGGVHLDIDPTAPGSHLPPLRPPVPEGDVAGAAALVAAARRPVAIVGVGALPWAEGVRSALARLGCPVLCTYQAAGVVDPEAPTFAGLFTNGAIERPVLEAADLVLAVGLDPVEPIPAAWTIAAPVVSVMGWPRTDPYYEPVAELVGPVGPLLSRLVARTRTHPEPELGGRARADALAALQPPPGPFGPVDLVQAAAELAPAGAIATVDAGAHFLAVLPWWPARSPRSLLISNGLATMGFALPAAIGASLARPGVPVACFVGDGGLAMTLAELETLARLALPVTVLVFDDAALSLIELKQKPAHGGAEVVRFAPVDYAAVASAMGLEAVTVTDADALRRVLAGGWDRPRVVDCRIDPSSYAHLIAVTRG